MRKAARVEAKRHSTGGLFREASGVSAFSIAGQVALFAVIPVLTRIYPPEDFGLFTIYLSVVNIVGSVAALRFERCIFIAEDAAKAYASFKLILLSVCATSAIVLAIGYGVSGLLPPSLRHLILLIPLGAACSGLAEAMNCWSLRFGRLRDFALGRLVLPLSMAILQLAFGLLWVGKESLIAAQILSQLFLIGFLAFRVLSAADVREIAKAPMRASLDIARQERKFPIFDLPATLVGFAIVNLPAILIGSLFGAAMAGFYGVAARLVTSPTTLIATPLSNVFLSEASRNPHGEHLRQAGYGLVYLSAALIGAPTLLLGLASPLLIPALLGDPWRITGQIMAALAIMAAAQAISTPLQEIPTLARRQEIRFVVDAVRTLLVFGPLLLCGRAGFDALHVIYFMSAGGAVGFVLRIVASLFLLNGYSSCVASLRSTPPYDPDVVGG
jgi:O-antigen/teichoic acid export membrane protein